MTFQCSKCQRVIRHTDEGINNGDIHNLGAGHREQHTNTRICLDCASRIDFRPTKKLLALAIGSAIRTPR